MLTPKGGFPKTTSTSWRGKKWHNIRNKSMTLSSRDSLTFKVPKLLWNSSLKFLTSTLIWQSKKKMWSEKMGMFWQLDEVELGKLHVLSWGYFRLKCFSRLGFRFTKRNIKTLLKIFSVNRQTSTTQWVCIAFSWLLLLFSPIKSRDTIKNWRITSRMNSRGKRRNLKKEEKKLRRRFPNHKSKWRWRKANFHFRTWMSLHLLKC